MIVLTENDRYHICNCGCCFVWNNQDIKPSPVGSLVVCPTCGTGMIVVVDDIKLQNPPIEGEKSE